MVNAYTKFTTTDGKVIDISGCETLSDVIEQLYEYKVYSAEEYLENFLPDVPTDENGNMIVEEMSEDEIFRNFVNVEQLKRFEESSNVVVLVGCGENIFLCDDKLSEVQLLEKWLASYGTFTA